jgi:hypothetical protein
MVRKQPGHSVRPLTEGLELSFWRCGINLAVLDCGYHEDLHYPCVDHGLRPKDSLLK